MGLLSEEDLIFAAEALSVAIRILKRTHCSLLFNATGLGLLDNKSAQILQQLLSQNAQRENCTATAFVYHTSHFTPLPSGIPLFQDKHEAADWLAKQL